MLAEVLSSEMLDMARADDGSGTKHDTNRNDLRRLKGMSYEQTELKYTDMTMYEVTAVASRFEYRLSMVCKVTQPIW